MHDREWFLRAIEAAPEDDVARLAFSDWLEENGDDDRARFIRLQVEYHRLYGGGRTKPQSLHRQDLQKQIDALLGRNREVWTAGVAEWMREESFARGFLNIFQMTGNQFLDAAGAFRAVAPLDTLFLRRLKGREAAVFACEHLAGVSRLSARGAQLSDAGVHALTSSPHLGRLRKLGLGRSVLGDAEDANKLTDASAVALAGADNLPSLTHLDLGGHKKITVAGIRAIVESERRAGLKSLDVSGGAAGPGVGEVFCGPAFRLTALEELKLSDHKLGSTGAETLAATPNLCLLRVLWLTNNKIDDRGVIALAASPHFMQLVDLDLWTNNLTDVGVLTVLASPVMRGVRKLELGANAKITDSSARAILDDGRPWEKVGLDGTQVSSALRDQIAARCALSG